MARKALDLTGQRFTKLVAIRQAGKYEKSGNIRWECLCDCGQTTHAHASPLVKGKIRSCGCVSAKRTHGMADTPTYNAWVNLRFRCQNSNHPRYKFYGERGIKVCERWQKFENFLADMGPKVGRVTLDRIDVNGNYEPENCRWVTDEVQANNRRTTRYIEFMGKSQSIARWARELNIPDWVIRSRLDESGWPVEKALTEPVRYSRRKV